MASAAPAPATTAFADFSLRQNRRPFRREARSPQVRTHSFIAQPPDLRRLSLGHKGFAVSCPLALLDSAFYPVLVHRLAIYDPRFLPTLGHPYAVALHFAHCDQLAGGLAPPGVRPCWAHMKNRTPVLFVANVTARCMEVLAGKYGCGFAPTDASPHHRCRPVMGQVGPRNQGCGEDYFTASNNTRACAWQNGGS